MSVKPIDFTPWQLRTIRVMALDQGAKAEASIDELQNINGPLSEGQRIHLRLLGDYLEMIRDMVDQIDDYAKEHGGI